MNKVRIRRTGVLVAGASLFAAMLSVMAPPAQAAAPSNDTYTHATRVSGLPYHARVDTRHATDEAVPPPGTKNISAHSVWWHMVPRKDGPVLISIQNSTFHVHVNLFRAARANDKPSKWARVGGFGARRGGAAMMQDLQKGQHYYLMVSTHSDAKGGTASLLVRNPAQLSLVLSSNGVYDSVDGSALIQGTIRSSQPGTVVSMEVELRQLVGTQVVSGWGETELTVGTTVMPWQLRVTSGAKFAPGEARIDYSSIRVYDEGARLETLHFDPNAVITLK